MVVLAVVTAATLILQLAAVRPVLNRRSDRVLAGQDLPRGASHLVYITLEALKVLGLLALGLLALTS